MKTAELIPDGTELIIGNAAHIVKCVNLMPEIIEALEVIEAMRSELNQDVESDRIIERQIKKLILILKRAKGGSA